MTNSERSAYNQGRNARRHEYEKSINPYVSMTNLWSWWLAGWNDTDIKLASDKSI